MVDTVNPDYVWAPAAVPTLPNRVQVWLQDSPVEELLIAYEEALDEIQQLEVDIAQLEAHVDELMTELAAR